MQLFFESTVGKAEINAYCAIILASSSKTDENNCIFAIFSTPSKNMMGTGHQRIKLVFMRTTSNDLQALATGLRKPTLRCQAGRMMQKG
jgi:hypothetical protein